MHLRYALMALLGEGEAHGYALRKRFTERVAPRRQLSFTLPQQWPNKTLNGLSEGLIWRFMLVLVELGGREEPAWRNEHLMQLIDH